jgi:colanic acid biosynthesis protein WcaH
MLPKDDYLRVVRDAPLVSLDLILRDPQGLVLIGLRNNRPAQGWWFVPGGVIRKDETLHWGFQRVSLAEIGQSIERNNARFLGAYEHLYSDNFAGEPGFGTHYIVLAHLVDLGERPLHLPRDQHQAYRWVSLDELGSDPSIHPNTRAYAESLRILT